MTDSKILDRVRKLLAQAEDPACTPAEAEAYNERAAELIAKYGIEQALRDEARPEGEKEGVGDRVVHVPPPYAKEKSALLHNVAKPLRVDVVRKGRHPDGGYPVHMFGFPADLERVELLFTSLLVQASLGLAAVRAPGNLVGYRKAWMWGFINAVRQRLEAAENRAVKEADEDSDGTSTALVLADRQVLVERRVAEVYPKLKTVSGGKNLSAAAYRAGQAAGQRADLGGARVNRAARGSIGQ